MSKLVVCFWLQMNRSRREADETMIQLEEQKRETGRVTRENEMELEKVCVRSSSNWVRNMPDNLLLTHWPLGDLKMILKM